MATCNEALRERLEAQYTEQLEGLRTELLAEIPQGEDSQSLKIDFFLATDTLDDRLAKFVVLYEATPKGLAEFAATSGGENSSSNNQELVEQLLSNADLLKQMVLADGAKDGQYGRAMQIYTEIQRERQQCRQDTAENGDEGRANSPVLDRLALAISLEHAVPLKQHNPVAVKNTAAPFVDPVQRYLNYEMAFLQGELDPAFVGLSTWLLRMVVDGDEPDETLAWGRKMLRNFRPDHVLTANEEWRYVCLVRSEIRYGSQDVKFDRDELQLYQNILMNGGICGRRAWIGRFILRAFGIPTTARPSKGHGALVHWTLSHGWMVNLGPGWGAGWTKGRYHKDVDFLATTQARDNRDAYWKVKRAQFVGDLLDEKRVFGAHDNEPNELVVGFWYGIALRTQQAIIDEKTPVTLLDEASNYEPTIAEKVLATPVPPDAKTITYHNDNNEIRIPAAAFENPRSVKEVSVFTSFRGGLQIYLNPFTPKGQTIMRGGTWKNDANSCTSGCRMLSGGYGKYNNWGFRVALSPEHSYTQADDDGNYPEQLTISYLDSDVSIEMVYIKPGTFLMGGESTEDGRFQCVEVPKHQVELTKGFYIGKYPVTQEQYEAMIGSNPSGSTKAPDCPVDNIGEDDTREFCRKFTETTGRSIRLPTEAEWEYACRAGSDDTRWFFGDDSSQMGEYAWFADNADGKSHPVGQKKPNSWGLYDMYGNVCERIADKYEKDYYAKSPPKDPEGPSPGTNSNVEYKINVARSGEYKLSAEVVTANYNQHMTVSVNGSETVMEMPFTCGDWQQTKPVALFLHEGETSLRFWRDKPPQYGLAVKDFLLTTANAPSTQS